VDDDVGAEDVTARREARKLTTLATSSGSAARLAQLGGAFGHEVRCAAAFGHCRPHGMPTTWIAPRDEDVRPAGSRLAGHRPSDTRVTSVTRAVCPARSAVTSGLSSFAQRLDPLQRAKN